MYLLLKNGGFFQSVMLLFSGVFVYDRFCDPHFKYCWFRNPIPNHLGYIYIYILNIKPCKNHGINYQPPSLKLVGNGISRTHQQDGSFERFFFASPPAPKFRPPKEGRCQSNQPTDGWISSNVNNSFLKVSFIYQHLQRGAKWFLKGINSPSLRV